MNGPKKFRILKFKTKPILTLRNISKSIDKRVILRKIDFEINKGEIFGLLGPNGAGKSVTFNVLLGIMKADHGEVYASGEKISNLPIHQRATKDKKEQDDIIEQLLSEFSLTHLKNVNADNLSGGERKKVVIARSLINKPKILLMDEPYGAVDPINLDVIKNIIVNLQKKNVSVLLTDHNAQNVLSIVDRCSIISDGSIVTSGTPRQIINDDKAKKLYFGENFNI